LAHLPTATGAAGQAAIYATEVRDDLYALGVFTPELRSAVSAYRARGGVVQIRPGFALGENHQAGPLLYELVNRLADGHKITLTPPDGSGPCAGTRIAVTPPDGTLAEVLGSLGLEATVSSDQARSVAVLAGSAAAEPSAAPPNGGEPPRC
jgi:hypothetical protein